MATLRGNLADIYWGYYNTGTFTTEAMTDAGDHKTWNITHNTYRFWDPKTVPTIYVGGVDHTDYFATVQYCGGQITSASDRGAVTVTASGKYFVATQLSQAHAWTLNASMDKEDTTVFGDTVKKQTAANLNGTITVSRFYPGSGGFGIQALAPSTYPRVALVLYETQSTGVRWECYATVDSVEYAVEAENIIPETVTFALEGTYGIYHYSS